MVDAHNEEKPSAEANLISLLHSNCKLPQYIVNCFITTGYDTVEVIKDMDDQKLNDMEVFINKHFPKNVKYIHPDYDTYMFPPGHRMRIIQVVQEMRSISLTNSRKLPHHMYSQVLPQKHLKGRQKYLKIQMMNIPN